MDDATKPGAARSAAEKAEYFAGEQQGPLTTTQVLWLERHELRPPGASSPDAAPVMVPPGTETEYRATAEAAGLTALCLSGGGIRSAAFSLGVVQALAAKGLLTGFDYLSTVSGGGYLGGFLQRWALGHPKDGRNEQGVADALGGSVNGRSAPELDRLRDGANFITPKLGLLSGDTWVALATSLRNISINWTLFLPLFMIVAAIPALFYWLFIAVGPGEAFAALVFEAVFLSWAMTAVGLGMPSYRPSGFWPTASIRFHILLPAMLGMVAILVVVASQPEYPALLAGWPRLDRSIAAAAMFVVAPVIGLVLAAAINRSARLGLLKDLPLWLLCGLAAALMLYAIAGEAIRSNYIARTGEGLRGAELLVIAGPLAFVLSVVSAGWLFSVLRTSWRSGKVLNPDLDREWLVRISGELLRPAILWGFLAFFCLFLTFYDPTNGGFRFGPHMVRLPLSDDLRQGGITLAGLASGLVAALAGRSGSTSLGRIGKWLSLETLAIIATILFTALVLVGAGIAVADAARHIADECAAGIPYCSALPEDWRPFAAHLALILALVLFLAVWGRAVDANRFSLNGFYRNRLARAFLGAARAGAPMHGDRSHDIRCADPFTGLDPADNQRLHSLWPPARNGGRPCLFPVVGVALNAVATKRLSWQERKALPFVLTPIACGSGCLGGAAAGDDPAGLAGAYVPSNLFGGRERDEKLVGTGITLAAAMAISGAAASPNMGYHTSPGTAFLMTLFNLRLGAWLPNPTMWKPHKRRHSVTPRRNAVLPLVRELAGRLDESQPQVYLSDGGHFDNLGLYEMVRRRCALILVVDATADDSCAFESLSGAVRKASIDLNVDIRFGEMKIRPRADATTPAAERLAYAVAAVDYPEKWSGKLIYLKPSLLDTAPIDVLGYGEEHADFPHQSTIDQWFAESQFESYRKLGQSLVAGLGPRKYSDAHPAAVRLDRFFNEPAFKEIEPAP